MIWERAERFKYRIAIEDKDGEHTYAELLDASARVASGLLKGRADLNEARICFLIEPGFAHVAVQWGIWRAGGIAVPLAMSHPPREREYVIEDSGAEAVLDSMISGELCTLPAIEPSRRAMMVYTSGTTGRPKGVVSTHDNLIAQITSLVKAWEWTQDDRILLVLPLHHVHGIINVLCCALWSGATCEMLPKFDAEAAWARLASGKLTLFMAVPTIYAKLIASWTGRQTPGLRLMVSGSAPLPVKTLETWREITGHTLLERYGMTELGMALSNPLHGERRPGCVGTPLPGVEVRLVDDEIEVRGPNVFLEYWNRPDATAAAFRDGWFRTGDTAVVENGAYRILGRSSVDILNPGGYKVSALEIEEVLRTHPAIAECAVVGVDDGDDERICVAVELAPGGALTHDELRAWAKDHLAPYKIPRALLAVAALPRNAMGKVVKPDVSKLF